MKRLFALLVLPIRAHFFGSFLIVMLVASVISTQMTDRRNFAASELLKDVMDRWGTPIVQAAPSIRFVPSGAVFNSLSALPFDSQKVQVTAAMNYRKRGLTYFSGFDFSFRADFAASNQEARDIDVAFVFPIDLEKNKVLLSDLVFFVDGEEKKTELNSENDRLLWTGRLKAGARVAFRVEFRGRGLDSFTYSLDPASPVRDFRLDMHITGGENFDYAEGVVPATETKQNGNRLELRWNYQSLQSGIPVGVILPSEKSYDVLIATMVRRCWAPFLLLFFGLFALCTYHARPLRFYESYLVAASYGLFFVLLAYFAAFTSFYPAWALSLLLSGGLLFFYLCRVLQRKAWLVLLGLIFSSLCLPTAAVFLQGYTGLIYTLEILTLIATAMVLTTRPAVREWIDLTLNGQILPAATQQGASHVP